MCKPDESTTGERISSESRMGERRKDELRTGESGTSKQRTANYDHPSREQVCEDNEKVKIDEGKSC